MYVWVSKKSMFFGDISTGKLFKTVNADRNDNDKNDQLRSLKDVVCKLAIKTRLKAGL